MNVLVIVDGLAKVQLLVDTGVGCNVMHENTLCSLGGGGGGRAISMVTKNHHKNRYVHIADTW